MENLDGAALATTKFVTGGEEAKVGFFFVVDVIDVSKLCSISFIPQNRDTQTHLCVFEGWWKASTRFINMKPRVGPDLPIKTLTDPNFQVPCQIDQG